MASSRNTITLRSSDGQSFQVEKGVMQYGIIKDLIDGDQTDIPLLEIEGDILAKVIEYCEKHATDDAINKEDKDLKLWDAEFLQVDQSTLFNIILAANYLEIKSLLDLTCQSVADMIRSKSPDEIRRTFNLKLDDWDPEEEEQVRRENEWAFD